jgi:hypothetical protein
MLRLPRKMTMDTSKVLRLPRKLQRIFWKSRKSIAPATQNDFQIEGVSMNDGSPQHLSDHK